MNIQEVLQNSTVVRDELHRIMYLRGLITADARSEYFRIYPLPNNEATYLVINRNDVAGDIYELTKEELTSSGFAGVTVHKIPLEVGTKIAYVKVESHRLGETMSSSSFDPNLPPGCNYTDGCATFPCCTQPVGGPCGCSSCCIAGANGQTKTTNPN